MSNGATNGVSRPLLSTAGQQLIVAVVILALAAAILYIVGFVSVPKENTTLLNVAEGLVLGWVGAIIAFYFPSSVGARSKDEAIATMSAALTSPPPGSSSSTITTHTVGPTSPASVVPPPPAGTVADPLVVQATVTPDPNAQGAPT